MANTLAGLNPGAGFFVAKLLDLAGQVRPFPVSWKEKIS